MNNSPLATQGPSTSVHSQLLGIWVHVTRRRRVQLCLLLLVMLTSGVAETISLGAVMPFLAVLTDPELLWQKSLIQDLASRSGYTQASHLLIPATLTFAMAALLAALIRLLNLWLNGRLAAAVGSDLSCEAYLRTLYQSYEVHIQRNSASVITGITTQVYLTVVALNSFLQMVTSAVVAGGLFVGLLVLDAPVAIAAATLFGSFYMILATVSQKELRRNSYEIAYASTQQIKALQEGLGAVRDVLLDGNQSTYWQIYRQADRPQRQLQAKNSFLATLPRYVLEGLTMIAIALLGGMLVIQRGSGAEVIPLLGTLALGAQRLLPALQQIYRGWASLKSYNAAIQDVLSMLDQPLKLQERVTEPLPICEGIYLKKIHFNYGPEQPEILQGLDLEIRRGERIGLIGATGSGKSTIADLLMGLLRPTSGRLLVDGADLHDPSHPDRLLAWRAAVAHVPQNVYLADSSFAENIAFGVPSHQIDMSRVRQAAEQAQIAGFIEASLEGYKSFVGERGIRLSGGQRQRIGIARALYKRARVLVFDEATSALDSSTEKAVMKSIGYLSKDITIVMIAHRLSTLSNCDRVIELAGGKVLRIVRPQDLGNFYPC